MQRNNNPSKNLQDAVSSFISSCIFNLNDEFLQYKFNVNEKVKVNGS